MKTKLTAIAFLSALILFCGCKKDNDSPTTGPTYPVEGLWIGSFTVDNNPSQAGTYYYSYAVYPDGSILVKSIPADGNTYYSSGNWTLSGDDFTATFISMNFKGPQVTQTIHAKFSNTGNMTDGTWTDVVNASQSGKLTMKRVN